MKKSNIEIKANILAISHAVDTYTEIIFNDKTSHEDKLFYDGQRYMLKNIMKQMNTELSK